MNKREPLTAFIQYRLLAYFCIVYLSGLIAGALYIAEYPFSSLMRLLVFPQMSIVIGFIVSALPFIVLYILFRLSAYGLVLPVLFLKAFTFMYCFGGISVAFADAGWLVRSLLLFSNCLSTPVLLWYVSLCTLGKRGCSDRYIWICVICTFAIRCVDSYVVSPFALKLLKI